MTCEFLKECRAAYHSTQERIHSLKTDLDDPQLLWRPTEQQWSIVEVVAHLALVRKVHLEMLEAAVAKARAKGVNGGEAPYGDGTILGRLLLGSLEKPTKLKTGRKFQPQVVETETERAFESFRASNAELMDLAQAADGLALDRIRVGAPPSPLVRISLAQGFRLHVLHDARHIRQVEALLRELGSRS